MQAQIINTLKPKLKKNDTKNYFREHNIKRTYKSSTWIYNELKENKEYKWLKHQRKVTAEKIEIINDNLQLSISWHFYKTELVRMGKAKLIDDYNLDERIYSQEELKEVSNYAFHHAFEDYQLLVGIDTLYGWKKEVEDEEIEEKITKWVNNKFRPKYKGSEIDFEIKFREHINKILHWKDTNQEMKTTARDFCTNIASTGTTGSAFDPDNKENIKVEDKVTDEKLKYKKNKYTKSAALSVSKKMRRLFAKKKQKANVSHKVEFTPKVRIIVSSDYNTTLKMRFIDQWLTTWLSGLDISTLFQTTKQTLRMWKIFSENKGYWNVPIDQTAFDHNVTKRMVIIMLEEIKQLIVDKALNNSELIEVMDSLIFSIDGGQIVYRSKNGIRTWEYESGILSGWQWTALLDTLANVAEFKIMCDLCEEHGIPLDVKQFNAQGDDGLVKLTAPIQCLALITAYAECGFQVHPRKTFISNKHNEYLRKYSKDNIVNGYPARMVTKLLWLYPGDILPRTEIEKITTTFSKWKQFAERLSGQVKDVMRYLKIEYTGLKIQKEKYMKYLSTSQINGGAGYLDTSTTTQVMITPNEQSKLIRIVDDVGYHEFRLRFGNFQGREMDQWFSSLITITDKKFEDEGTGAIGFTQTGELNPLKFEFIETNDKPKTDRSDLYPSNVIFGESKELMFEVFPRINTFIEQSRAPKKWIYDYLTGRLDEVTPRVDGLSDEFASLVYNSYKASLINSMYYKRVVPDKWKRLNLYAERHFNEFIKLNQRHLPKMF